jgi:hypothetical protein
VIRSLTMTIGAPAIVLMCAATLVGCTSGGAEPPEPVPGSGAEVTEGYPEGPYGTNKGSTVQDFAFPGYARPAEGLEDRTFTVHLNDFYNPSGEDVYPEGSPYGEGTPKPTVLMMTVGAGWCGPCKQEAAETLPPEYAALAPRGLELMVVMADTAVPGEPAGFTELDGWINQFDVNYPAVIDPKRLTGSLFNAGAFPSNALIDTSTMKIVESIQGAPQDSFWVSADSLLNE